VGADLPGGAIALTDSTVNGNVTVDANNIANVRSTITGTIGGVNTAAYASFLAAYSAVAQIPRSAATALTGTLANRTLAPGIYSFNGAAALTGTLTLDNGGNANATWTFLIGTWPHNTATTPGTGALTATNFTVVMAGNGNPGNVTWWAAEAVTLTTSNVPGTILAGAAITLTGPIAAPGKLYGHAFAKAAVTVTDYTFDVSTTTTVGGGGNGNPGKDCDRDKDRDRHYFNKHYNWCQGNDWNRNHKGDRDKAPDKDRYDRDNCWSNDRHNGFGW
jgi:hypothetical protein